MTTCTECEYVICSMSCLIFDPDFFCGHPSVKRPLRRKRDPVTGEESVYYGDGYSHQYPFAYMINTGNCPMWKARKKKIGFFRKLWMCIFTRGGK